MLCCKNGRSRPLRRCHKRRGESLGMRPVFPESRLSTRPKARCARAIPSAPGNSCSPRHRARACAGTIHSSTRRAKPCNSRVRKSSSAASRKKASSTSSAIRAARCSTSTTSSSSRTRSSTCWCATSRARCTRPTAIRARRTRSASRWSPRGPGVTNAVTGIATAYMDSIPMVVITGQVPTHAIGQDAFQECDTVGITRPVRQAQLPGQGREGPRGRRSRRRSTSPPPAGRARCWSTSRRTSRRRRREFDYPKTVSLRSYNPVTKGHAGQIKKAVQLLLEAKRPMIYAGGGVILTNAVGAADASWCACWASRAPTR